MNRPSADRTISREPPPCRGVLFLGLPGTGKGTQGRAIGTLPTFVHIDAGEIFRNVNPDSAEGKAVHEHMARGELLPDHLAVRLWMNDVEGRISNSRFDPSADWLILDGLPRTVQQAEMISHRVEVVGVIHLTCEDEEVLVARLRERGERLGRADDANEATVRRRLEAHRREIQSLLRHYPTEMIHHVNACAPLLRVLQGAAGAMANIAESEPA